MDRQTRLALVGLIVVLILAVATLAWTAELHTEWLFRTIPTSQPLVPCPNGREAKIKCLRGRPRGNNGTGDWFIGNFNGRVCPLRFFCPGPRG